MIFFTVLYKYHDSSDLCNRPTLQLWEEPEAKSVNTMWVCVQELFFYEETKQARRRGRTKARWLLGRGTKSDFLPRDTFSRRWTTQRRKRAEQPAQEVREAHLAAVRLECCQRSFGSLERWQKSRRALGPDFNKLVSCTMSVYSVVLVGFLVSLFF